MSVIELGLKQLGLRNPPLEDYRKTLFVAILILMGLVVLAYVSDVEEEEGSPSRVIALTSLIILVLTVLYETVSLLHEAAEPLLAGAVICLHCQHLNPRELFNSQKEGPEELTAVPCQRCRTPLVRRHGIVKVNFGTALTSLGLPRLFTHLAHVKLEYPALLGARPASYTHVEGDLVEGDKTLIRDSVLDRTTIGETLPGPPPVPRSGQSDPGHAPLDGEDETCVDGSDGGAETDPADRSVDEAA